MGSLFSSCHRYMVTRTQLPLCNEGLSYADIAELKRDPIFDSYMPLGHVSFPQPGDPA